MGLSISKRAQVHLASVALSLAILAMTALLILVVYVPQVAAYWMQARRPLAPAERWLVGASHAVQGQYIGFSLFLLLGTVLAAALVWRIVVSMRLRRAGTGS